MKRLLLLFLLCFGLALPGVAADGTSFNPTTISVKSVGASIPVGTVITWPSNSWPSDRDNWLECNGQSISSAVYPELVGVIGSRVPDYRGRFLRGLQSGHSVGETVANTLKSHNHTTYAYTFVFRSARQHSLIRYCGRAIIFFCGKSRSQRVGCRTIHHERRSGGTNISGSTKLRGNMDFHQPNRK